MAEPPGGANYGRKRNGSGGWDTLGDEPAEKQAPPKRAAKPLDTVVHGTLAAYNNDRCRCAECRTAFALYRRNARREMFNQQSMTVSQEPPRQSKSTQSSLGGRHDT